MSISGSLKTMHSGDLLQWCGTNLKTGTLRLRRGPIEKQLFFKGGRLFSSTSIIESNTELLILITPRVIDSPAEGIAAIEDFEDEMQDLFKEIRRRGGAVWEQPSDAQAQEGAATSSTLEPGRTASKRKAEAETDQKTSDNE